MNSSELYDRFRRRIDDVAEPYMWHDDDVYDFMDDAQKMFCRLTNGITDATSKVTTVRAVDGEEFSSYDKRILKINRMQKADGTKIDILNYRDLGRVQLEDYGLSSPSKIDSTEGTIYAGITDIEEFKIRWYKVPDTSADITLWVQRLPLDNITGPNQELEISEEHHRHLLDWMESLAMKQQDAETFDRARSEQGEARFRAYCENVRQEQERRRHKDRVMNYGGIL